MYLRRITKKKNGADYDCWTLVESIRTARSPRQRIVATIGKLPGLDREERIGWDEIGRILSGKMQHEPGLFLQSGKPPNWATVNITSVSVERLRHFGDVYLGLLLWGRLNLAEKMLPRRQDIPSIMAAILVLARFCAPSSSCGLPSHGMTRVLWTIFWVFHMTRSKHQKQFPGKAGLQPR